MKTLSDNPHDISALYAESLDTAVALMRNMRERFDALAKTDEVRFLDAKGAEQLRSEVAMLERGIDRVQKFLTDAVRLDLENRRLALERDIAEQVQAAVEVAISRASLDPERESIFRDELSGALKELDRA